jgi:tetratricopeptide (TPR) repeat protein
VSYVAPSYLYVAETMDQLNQPKEALKYYQRFYNAKRTLSFRGEGPAKARKEYAQAAKLLGDHSQGWAQLNAYRGATRTWSQLIDDPKAADLVAGQYDVVLAFGRFFDARKDWPDAQAAYQVAQKIATLNFVKNPSDTSWRDKAEAAEKASVEAEQAAETASADAPN